MIKMFYIKFLDTKFLVFIQANFKNITISELTDFDLLNNGTLEAENGGELVQLNLNTSIFQV